MYALYSLGLTLLTLGYLPVFLVGKVWRAGTPLLLRQRLGWVPVAPGPERFWVHAVSVGEVTAAVPLVRALRARWPAAEIVVSTVTATGARVARQELREAAATFAFPLDVPGAVRRAVRRVRPRAFIALETELWPNLLRALHRAGVPAVLANGRISDRSYRRYRHVRWFFRGVLGHVALFAMQTEESARRIRSLGAPPGRVVVTGNLKMDVGDADSAASGTWRRRLRLDGDPLWVAGSTHAGEEEAVLSTFLALREAAGRLRLVLAPRHPERVAAVEQRARAMGLRARRRSRVADAVGPEDVVLLDTVGELAGLYAAADVVFVGGSLVPVGGHNVIEPARLGKPIVFGPYMMNFREVASLLLAAGGALQVPDAAALAEAVGGLLRDPTARGRLGAAARAAVVAHEGATERTIAAIEAVLSGGR